MLSTESTMNLDWTSLQGTTLEGGYQVGELLESDGHLATFRVRILGDFARKAFAKFYPARANIADEQISLWERERALQHPNLCAPIGSGRVLVDGAEAIFVVLARADERLDRVIKERPLATDEAQEVFDVLVSALTYLHGQGLVHGCLAPEQVFAFGNSIKISTMCARAADNLPPIDLAPAKYLAPESTSVNLSPASDVWCLGATIFEAFTQRQYAAENRNDVAGLPQPFAAIVDRCLAPDPAARPALSDLKTELLKTSAPLPAPTAAPPAPTRPVPAERYEQLIRRRSNSEQESHFPIRRAWIYAALGVIALALLIWAALPRHAGKAVLGAAAPPDKTAWPTRTLGETAASEPPRNAPVPAPTRPQPSSNTANWRVILYTFAHEKDAQQKAKALNGRHPNLNATVFTPSNGKFYLVASGGPMTREEAAKARQRAIRMGMPSDSYIQNYKQ